MRRLTYLVVLLAALGLSCGDDDGGTGGTPDARTGGGDGGGGGGDGGGGADSGGGGADSMVGGPDANESAAAQEFCDLFDANCGYGAPGYADEDECLNYYMDATEACRTCIRDHVDNMPSVDHCPHSWADGICDGAPHNCDPL